MADLAGTIVIAPVVPTSTDDTYATHHALYGRGGLRTVPDTNARDDIPADRLEPGCLVYCESNDKYYKRVGSGWVEFATGGGGGGDLTYVHVQSSPSDMWLVAHNLGKFPSIKLKDAAGFEFGPNEIYHVDENACEIYLFRADTGVAFFN